jgi:hypothetical protein
MAKRTTKTATPTTRAALHFSAINGILLAAGFASIVLGYSLLAKDRTRRRRC